MKQIEDTWPNKFKDEVQKHRLRIYIDGINPFSKPNTTYIIFPLVAINKNTPPPPWLSMKNEHLMLALIVPSRRQVKNMDSYLQPLINKFKQLCEGKLI